MRRYLSADGDVTVYDDDVTVDDDDATVDVGDVKIDTMRLPSGKPIVYCSTTRLCPMPSAVQIVPCSRLAASQSQGCVHYMLLKVIFRHCMLLRAVSNTCCQQQAQYILAAH